MTENARWRVQASFSARSPAHLGSTPASLTRRCSGLAGSECPQQACCSGQQRPAMPLQQLRGRQPSTASCHGQSAQDEHNSECRNAVLLARCREAAPLLYMWGGIESCVRTAFVTRGCCSGWLNLSRWVSRRLSRHGQRRCCCTAWGNRCPSILRRGWARCGCRDPPCEWSAGGM